MIIGIIGSPNFIGTSLNWYNQKRETIIRINYVIQLTSSTLKIENRHAIFCKLKIETYWQCRIFQASIS